MNNAKRSEKCFKCGRRWVDALQLLPALKWRIVCRFCGVKTPLCDTIDETVEKWEKMKEQKDESNRD